MKIDIKKILYVLVVICVISTIYILKDTYGLFERNASGDANFDIASWVISLNNIDISSGVTSDFTASNFIYTVNSHVKDGKIAPGRSGYFDVIIDPAGTDVAVRYDITLSLDGEYEDNILYYVTTSDGTMIRTDVNTYSGVIDLSSIDDEDVATLRINIEWDDDGNHDSNDTELGLSSLSNISIPTSVHVVQYLGETLTEYVEPVEEPGE